MTILPQRWIVVNRSSRHFRAYRYVALLKRNDSSLAPWVAVVDLDG